MIELYRLEDLNNPYAEIPVTSGSITGERNGYYGLSFSILSKYLKQHHILIDHNTIFKIDGLFYVSADTSNSDTEKIELTINAELLQTQLLMFKWIDILDLASATLSEALMQILSGTIFSVGTCDDIGIFDFKIEKNNAQYALSELIKQTDTEIVYEGLTVNLKNSNWQDNPLILKKGYDFTTLNENTDVSDVITRLFFKSSDGALSGVIDSPHASKYSFIREGYQEFEASDISTLESKAAEYLSTMDKPRCSISISIPKVKRTILSLGQTVTIHNTLLNEEVVYKVVGYNKSLTKEADTYQLGERKKDFTDIQQMISNEVQEIAPEVIVEVFYKEVISANTAHLLNVWIRDLNVEFLETNFDALDVRKDAPEGNLRNCIRIKEEELEFVTQSLSTTETMDYKNKDGDQIYYTSINNQPDAYKYFTITSPSNIYKNLTPEQLEAFKVKVRKVLTESVKASFKFGMTEGNTQYPLMVWGVGTDAGGATNRGKGFIYKELDGLILKYVTSTGVAHQIKLGENGIEGIPLGEVIDIGGLIELPGDALTRAVFYNDGMELSHGEIKTSFSWTTDSSGKIISLKNLKTNVTVPISWSTAAIPK